VGFASGEQGRISKILVNKVCFLSFQWEKTNITTFLLRKIFEKSSIALPWTKYF